MRYFTLLILLLFLDACNKGKTKRIQYKSNDKVIDFKISTAMNVDEITQLKQSEYKKISSDKFNSKTDTIKYNNDEIYISYLTLPMVVQNMRGMLI